MTRSSMSVTSSASRRPFGKPAVSPASTPKRFGVALGGTPRLSLSVSAAAGLRADLGQSGHAGQQRLDDVRPVRLLDAEA